MFETSMMEHVIPYTGPKSVIYSSINPYTLDVNETMKNGQNEELMMYVMEKCVLLLIMILFM